MKKFIWDDSVYTITHIPKGNTFISSKIEIEFNDIKMVKKFMKKYKIIDNEEYYIEKITSEIIKLK